MARLESDAEGCGKSTLAKGDLSLGHVSVIHADTCIRAEKTLRFAEERWTHRDMHRDFIRFGSVWLGWERYQNLGVG